MLRRVDSCIACIALLRRAPTDDTPAVTASRTRRQTAILARFEEYLAEKETAPDAAVAEIYFLVKPWCCCL